jgi:FkbH-like protein
MLDTPSPASGGAVAARQPEKHPEKKVVKVVVWDLDETLWHGTLLEGDDVRLRDGVVDLLATLDGRGILHSLASRNDHDHAMGKLRELGVADFFLYPQIGWGSKAAAMERIAQLINVGLDSLCFIDDQPFEREEVTHSLPQVMTAGPGDIAGLAARPEFNPRFVTDESRIRRRMYQADERRNLAEEGWEGPKEDFLASLGMKFTIAPVAQEDLKRAEELTVRTHQLNTTGYTYSYDELDALRGSPRHLLRIASLEDKYGPYGKIGLALVDKEPGWWTIKLLLMSCRVMSRGVGTLLLNHILGLAREAGVGLRAEFRANDRNRMMLVTYKFAGFREVAREGDLLLFENDLRHIQPPPPYVDLTIVADAGPA